MNDKIITSASSSCNESLRWAVFISGFGSNLQAILDAEPKINVQLVVSNSAEAYGIKRAQNHGVKTLITPFIISENSTDTFNNENVVNSKKNRSRKIDWEKLNLLLKEEGIDWIFLAGFMKIIPLEFIQNWKGRMLNLHPSLLPDFPGLNAIEKSFESGHAMGATVHFVTEELDGGPILLQKVALSKEERTSNLSLEEAANKIHAVEHQITVEAIRVIQNAESNCSSSSSYKGNSIEKGQS